MIKNILKSSVIYTIGDFLVVAVSGIFLLPYYTRAMSISEYSVYSVFIAAIGLVTFIVHFGIVSTFSRMYFTKNSEKERNVYTGQLLIIHCFIVLFFVLFIYLIKGYILSEWLSSIKNDRYLYIIVAISSFSFVVAIYSGYLRVTEKPKLFILFQLSAVFLYVFFIFILRQLGFEALDAVIFALLISTTLMWLVSIYFLPFTLQLKGIVNVSIATMKFSLPILIAYLLYFCLNKYNVLFLQNHVDENQVAYFNFALQLSSILMIVAGAAGKAIQPALYKLPETQVIGTSINLARYYKLTIFTLFIVIFVFSERVILFFAPDDFLKSEDALRVLLISAFIYNFRSVEATLFLYFNKPKYTLYITSFSALIVVSFSAYFVPNFGVMASSYSILLGSITAMLTNVVLVNILLKRKECI
ncbi:lipopolysaccharide biosynthesis protein [Shewanella pneumatophori]|uniref:Oligosaccharide flippase family protein n=1 Tax=Shewanella pneumatophori TaxID=314092 RepID=A0A9X1ZGM1_9GAMM|nr:oligosaccharide flippase family protein [Shewanella pneumatophori]MCL1139590.1 oligosaccharide flippase family protein [Shewanella pneumatophori]